MRVLMCRPSALPELAGDRSWLPDAAPLDRAKADAQWDALRHLVDEHVAPVIELPPEPWASAMTFTRDLGVLVDGRLIALEPHLRRGALEAPLARRAFESLAAPVTLPDPAIRLDGGTVLADTHGRLLIGTTDPEGDRAAAEALEELTGRPAYKVPVAGGRFPHLDMALCDLGGSWLVHPGGLAGFDRGDPAWRELLLDLPVIEVGPGDGERLACNLVVGQGVAVGPPISATLRRRIEECGIAYHPTPLDELAKAGGGAHCLTLELPSS